MLCRGFLRHIAHYERFETNSIGLEHYRPLLYHPTFFLAVPSTHNANLLIAASYFYVFVSELLKARIPQSVYVEYAGSWCSIYHKFKIFYTHHKIATISVLASSHAGTKSRKKFSYTYPNICAIFHSKIYWIVKFQLFFSSPKSRVWNDCCYLDQTSSWTKSRIIRLNPVTIAILRSYS